MPVDGGDSTGGCPPKVGIGMSDEMLTEDDASPVPKARGDVEVRGSPGPSCAEGESSGLTKVDARRASKRAGVRVPSSSTNSERDCRGGETAEPAKSRFYG